MLNDYTTRQKKTSTVASTQLYLNIAEIKDNLVVLKNGGIRAILQTSSINFNLKSEPEQEAIIISYQNFLNTLEFPIQIVIRSRKLDVFKYLDNLKELAEKQLSPLLKKQTAEYREYIKKLVEYAEIMEKLFFIVVPYDPPRAQKQNILTKFLEYITPQDSIAKIQQRKREFDSFQKNVQNRVNLVKTGLTNCGLRIEQLKTPAIIELFYNIYNPVTSRNEKLTDLDKINISDV
jgi:hypothetical protein